MLCNSRKYLLAVLASLVLACVSFSTARADSQLIQPDIRRILDRGVLVVGLCALETPPFFYEKPCGELAGIDIQLSKAIAEELGVKLEFRRFDSFDEVINQVSGNYVDVGISNLSITFHRAKKVLYTQPYLTLHMGMMINLLRLNRVIRPDSDEYSFNNPDVRMAILAHSSYEGFAETHFPLAQRIPYSNWSDMLAATSDGKVDLAFYDEVAIERTLLEDPSYSLKFQYVKLFELLDPIAIAVPPQSPHLYSWLQHFITLNPVNQDLGYHFNRYFSDISIDDTKDSLACQMILARKERELRYIVSAVAGMLVAIGLFLCLRKGRGPESHVLEYFKWMLSPWTIFSGMALGVAYGVYFKEFVDFIAVFGDIYLTFLSMCSLPIMITAVITSIGKMLIGSDSGRYFKRLVTMFLIVLTVASIYGFAAAVLSEPGSSLSQEARETLGNQLYQCERTRGSGQDESNLLSFLQRLIPANIFSALSDNDVLGVLIFSIILGTALGLLKTDASEQVILQLEAIFSAFINVINSSMYILPLALFCLMAKQISGVGVEVLLAMSRFVGVYIIITIIATVGVGIFMARYLGIRFLTVMSSLRQSLIVAFGTANSYGAMPFAIEALETKFNFNKRDTNLVMPLGLTLCRPGTILNLVFGTVFMAQLFNISLMTDYRWLIVIFGVLLSGFAAAGAPSAVELSMLSIVLGFLGLPVEIAIILLLSVDPITDPFRTVLNVITSCGMTSLIANRELPPSQLAS